MRWKGRQGSSNIEDRRRGGGGGRARRVGTRLGLGTIVIVIIGLLLGENPMELLQRFQGASPAVESTQAPRGSQPTDELGQCVSVVLKDTEDVWKKIFREQLGRTYREPTLVLFDGQVRSACGFASAATGPFYCPADEKLYIDLSFYRELKDRFRAPGDFAMAYVVAHEVAHHVQNLLGITDEVSRQRRRLSQTDYNQLSVRLELQADFLAGVWARYAQEMKNILEKGDIEEALGAANAIGDDRLQRQSQGYVVPESFTHGTSEQRMRWFKKGLETGDLNQGDTFSASRL
ncbi:MAG: metalloprotease [Bacteroidetes bacterium]|nr:MAG: metalloprotease [Bacteroidota bacterium]